MTLARALTLLFVATLGTLALGALGALPAFRWLRPDFALLIVIYLGLTPRGSAPGTVALAVAIGYLADLVGGAPRGLHALTYAIFVLALRGIGNRLMFSSLIQSLLVAWVVALLHVWVLLGLVASVYGESVHGVGATSFVIAMTTALVALPTFALCRGIDRRLQPDPRALRLGF